MLIIKIEQNSEYGARQNQFINGSLKEIPEGWATVPPELEQEALSYLPFIALEIVDGEIVGVSQGEIPEMPPEPEPPLNETTQLRLAIAELAEAQAILDLENKLAIAELAETILGGDA